MKNKQHRYWYALVIVCVSKASASVQHIAVDHALRHGTLRSTVQARLHQKAFEQTFMYERPVAKHEIIMPKAPQENTTFALQPQSRCAVCFIGQLRGLGHTAAGLRTKLLEPIAAGALVDVFVAAEQGGPWGIENFGLPFHAHGQEIILRKFTWRAHQSSAEITNSFASKAPAAALSHYRSTPGNWVAPLFGYKGNSLRFYHLERDCIDMISQSEIEDHKTYTWVMRTRPDFVWIVPHPSLSLTDLSRVWNFNGENYGGVNSRHIFGRRDMMLNLMDRMRLLEVGDPVVYSMPAGPENNDEEFLEVLANKLGTIFGTIAYSAYLYANPTWAKSGWKQPGTAYSSEELRARATADKWRQPGSCWGRMSDSHIDIQLGCYSFDSVVSFSNLGRASQELSQEQLHMQSEEQVGVIWGSTVLLAVIMFVYNVERVSNGMTATWNSLQTVATWLAVGSVYTAWVGLLVVVNKYLAQENRFPFPAVLITMHMFCSSAASHAAYWYVPDYFPAARRIEQLSGDARTKFDSRALFIAILVAVTLVCENAALFYCGIGFLQMLKEPGLFLIYALSIYTQQDTMSTFRMALVTLIVVGGGMCTHGELNFVLTGFLLQCCSTVAKAVQLVLQGALLKESDGFNLDPLSYVAKICPICFAVLCPVAACEVVRVSPSAVLWALKSHPFAILLSCALATGTNVLVAMVIKRFNPLGFACLGSLKNAAIIAFGVFFLGELWTSYQTIGCILIFVAVPAYAWRKSVETEKKPVEAEVEPSEPEKSTLEVLEKKPNAFSAV